MKKTILQGLATAGLFFLLWFLLSQIDWVQVLNLEKVSDKTEQKLGALVLDSFDSTETDLHSALVTGAVDSLVSRLCLANEIPREEITVHIFVSEEVNAFAVPDGHLVLYTGLIAAADNEAELSGVIAHELAHIQLNHVMQNLINELGLSVLISMTTGNAEITGEVLRVLSSSAFSRSVEKEADLQAVDYLAKAGIDPEPFANFLYKLSAGTETDYEWVSWISTHPESKARAQYVIDHIANRSQIYMEVLHPITWREIKLQVEAQHNL